MSHLIAIPRSRKSIIDYANIIRKIANTKNEYFDVIKFIEIIAYDITGLEMEIVEDYEKELASNEYAKYIPAENCIKVRKSVYDAAADGIGKDRFTLAHELGHALLHREMALYRGEKNPETYENPEWQANEFSANVLCPLNKIRGMNVYEISEKFQVSLQVAENQLKKLERFKYE